MSELTPQNSAPIEAEAPLVSTGMGRGLHSRTAIALTVIAIVAGVIAQSISTLSIGFLMLAGAIGLLGEVPVLLTTGEARARFGEYVKANRLLVIRRADSPVRFYFYVALYLVLGSFSLLVAFVSFVSMFLQHAK